MSVYDSIDTEKVRKRAEQFNNFRAPVPVLRSLLMGTFENVVEVYRESQAEPSSFTASRRRLLTPKQKQGELTADMLVPSDSVCSAFAGLPVREVFSDAHNEIDCYLGYGVRRDKRSPNNPRERPVRIIVAEKQDVAIHLSEAYTRITPESVAAQAVRLHAFWERRSVLRAYLCGELAKGKVVYRQGRPDEPLLCQGRSLKEISPHDGLYQRKYNIRATNDIICISGKSLGEEFAKPHPMVDKHIVHVSVRGQSRFGISLNGVMLKASFLDNDKPDKHDESDKYDTSDKGDEADMTSVDSGASPSAKSPSKTRRPKTAKAASKSNPPQTVSDPAATHRGAKATGFKRQSIKLRIRTTRATGLIEQPALLIEQDAAQQPDEPELAVQAQHMAVQHAELPEKPAQPAQSSQPTAPSPSPNVLRHAKREATPSPGQPAAKQPPTCQEPQSLSSHPVTHPVHVSSLPFPKLSVEVEALPNPPPRLKTELKTELETELPTPVSMPNLASAAGAQPLINENGDVFFPIQTYQGLAAMSRLPVQASQDPPPLNPEFSHHSQEVVDLVSSLLARQT